MERRKRFFCFCWIVLVGAGTAHGQNKYPQNDFQSPVDTPIYLAGNFGELRSNHFHAGLDMKTSGMQGIPIRSVADGFVSRIKIAHRGYGKLLFVQHANGYTSVYGHLKNYNQEIEDFILVAQTLRESYEIDVVPGDNQIPIKAGELIAYSGNTGGSRAPHLHFEIRDTKTNNAINPLMFGFKVADGIKPQIFNIRAYAMDDSSFVSGQQDPRTYHVYGANGNYRMAHGLVVKGSGNVGFAVDATDRMDGTYNIFGVHEIRMYVDSELVYYQMMEELDFKTNRYMNGHTDYPMLMFAKRNYHRTHQQPNDLLNIYPKIKNSGILKLTEGASHTVIFEVTDFMGNSSSVAVEVAGDAPNNLRSTTNPALQPDILPWDRENKFKRDDITIYFPPRSFYTDLRLEYYSTPAIAASISPVHHIHNGKVPVQEDYTIKIKVLELREDLQDKALIGMVSGTSIYSPLGGKYRDGWVSARTNQFGKFTVVIDTVAPFIKPIDIATNKNLSRQSTINFSIGDGLSGLGRYALRIDGQWVLSEFEPKNARLTHRLDKTMNPGSHELELEVLDERGNSKVYKTTFQY